MRHSVHPSTRTVFLFQSNNQSPRVSDAALLPDVAAAACGASHLRLPFKLRIPLAKSAPHDEAATRRPRCACMRCFLRWTSQPCSAVAYVQPTRRAVLVHPRFLPRVHLHIRSIARGRIELHDAAANPPAYQCNVRLVARLLGRKNIVPCLREDRP